MRIKQFRLLLIGAAILFIAGCQNSPVGRVVNPFPGEAAAGLMVVLKSGTPLPAEIPDTLAADNIHIVLLDYLGVVQDIEMTTLPGEVLQDYPFQDVVNDSLKQKVLRDEYDLRYIAAARIVSYEKPSFSVSFAGASSNTQTYNVGMELDVFDLVSGTTYSAYTTAGVSQRANAFGLSYDASRTVGEESALGVALDKGIADLVSLLF